MPTPHLQGGRGLGEGSVVADAPGKVVLRSRVRGTRIVDVLGGEQLPRIR